MTCDHEICGNIQKVWLPFEDRGNMRGLKSHPYCLIAKDFEKLGDFDDAFSVSSFVQEQIFINIVKKYSGLSEHMIRGALQYHF